MRLNVEEPFKFVFYEIGGNRQNKYIDHLWLKKACQQVPSQKLNKKQIFLLLLLFFFCKKTRNFQLKL